MILRNNFNFELMMFIIIIVLLIIFLASTIFTLKRLKKESTTFEILTGSVYLFSIALFAFGMLFHSNPYYKAIDPIDGECYSPFANNHILTLIFYFLVFNISLLLVWTKSKTLPPLTLVLSLISIVIGVIINLGILYQISIHDTSSIDIYYASRTKDSLFFLFTPLLSTIIGIRLFYKIMRQEIRETNNRTYSNKHINNINTFLSTKTKKPFWIFLLMIPVFILVTLILILFGQDTNSIIKVFTDTTTWRLSQQIHPPILDHKGHYLCTVAASGHPKIVKPLRIGRRNGRNIIVNRQLQIANAFEEMIQDFSPKIHSIIRKNYDNYGFNISTKINSIRWSNITYILMKPLEWIFLICLYLFCNKPEEKIHRQYTE